MNEITIKEKIKSCADICEQALKDCLAVKDDHLESLFEAERYSLLAGGKRIRPFLTLAFSRALGGNESEALVYACALEMIHTYSLIHDDLPAMDNDDYRRGRPTNHKVFGEARAILAGDALLTRAFETVASSDIISDKNKARAVLLLSKAAGDTGMIGGQEMDMKADANTDLDTLVKLQSLKTGALIRCAGELGVLSADKYDDESTVSAVRCYCDLVGRAFQVTDDILDVTESEETMGKSLSDGENNKITFLSFMSIEEAKKYAFELTEGACLAVKEIDSQGELCSLARYLYERRK